MSVCVSVCALSSTSIGTICFAITVPLMPFHSVARRYSKVKAHSFHSGVVSSVICDVDFCVVSSACFRVRGCVRVSRFFGLRSTHQQQIGSVASAVYLYFAKNFSWNDLNRPSISFSFSGWGRIVVRKWYVPGRCPKPVPGTMQIPVSSSSWNA